MAKKPAIFIPQDGNEFTAEWFNDLFQETYGAAVLDVEREVIGTGVGFVGEIHRCSLFWDADRPDLPQSVIVKVPSKLPLNRSLGEGLQLYDREVTAYQKLSANMGLPMPKVFNSAMDNDSTPWLDSVITFLFSRLPLGAISWLTVKFLELASKNPKLRRYVLVLEDISDEYKEKITIGKLDVDENPEIASKYQIRGIPTMMLFNNGTLIDTKVGMSSKSDLIQWIDNNI